MKRDLPQRAFALMLVTAAIYVTFSGCASSTTRTDASIDPRKGVVGDAFTYSVTIAVAYGDAVMLSKVDAAISKFDILDKGTKEKRLPDRRIASLWYRLTGYAPGEYTIPPGEVIVTDRDGKKRALSFESVTFSIVSALKDIEARESTTKIGAGMAGKGMASNAAGAGAGRDIEAPIRFKIADALEPLGQRDPMDIVTACAAAVSIPVICYLLLDYLRGRTKKRAPGLSKDEEAVVGIAALKSKIDNAELSVADFYDRLLDLIETYIKRSFFPESGALTAKEFMEKCDAIARLPEEGKGRIRKLVGICTLAKYSGTLPEGSQMQLHLEEAKLLIEAISPPAEAGKAGR